MCPRRVPLSSGANRRVNMACMWGRSCTAFDQNRNWRSRNDVSTSSRRRGIRRAGPVDGRAIGLVIKFAQILLAIAKYLAARRGRGAPTGAGTCRRRTRSTRRARTSRRVEGSARPSGRERRSVVRLAFSQAMDGETDVCTSKCFKLVPLGDPVPGHDARGVIDPGPGRQAVKDSDDPEPGRRELKDSYDPVPGRRAMKDDLIPGRLGQGPLIIDDEDDEDGKRSWEDVAELAQQHSGQGWSSDWKAGKQVRVVDDEMDPELRCAGWMAAKSDVASVAILAHDVAESELDDGLAMEEPA